MQRYREAMETCSVYIRFLVLALFFSQGYNQAAWIDLKASGIRCGMGSYHIGSFQNDCYAAINGNIDRTYKAGNCIHTGYNDFSPFWWVDMGQTYSVHYIRIYTQAGHESRLSYITVTIDQHEVYSSSSAKPGDYLDINLRPLPVTGRYLRITRNAPANQHHFINICEVQVLGEKNCSGNLASKSCSENVTCSQSSIFSDGIRGTGLEHEIHGTSADCHGAINGNTSHNWVNVNGTGPPNCFSTKSELHPYWWVDLGRTVNIHKITMHIEWHGELDEAIVKVDDQQILRFPLHSNSHNPHIINDTLPRAGRNISVQHTQKGNALRIVMLCEVQIWGCPVNKYGGPHCEHTCSVHCNGNGGKTTCDSITGNCIKDCQLHWWGDDCSLQCHPARCSYCDRHRGCLQCTGQFAVPNCTVCSEGYYKSGSSQSESCIECGVGCRDRTCSDGDGHCQCLPGYKSTTCQQACVVGRYGQDCEERCSNGCNGPCNTTDGTCTCLTGWTGDRCQNCTNTFYYAGTSPAGNCTRCGPGCFDGICADGNGYCTCLPGWQPDTCSDACDARRYGQNCLQRCSNGCNGTCNTTDGTCSCLTGWTGDRCQDCTNTFYNAGTSRAENCTRCGPGCVDGKCADGNGYCTCLPGWQPDTCSDACDAGQYGQDCEERCSNGCNGTCNTTDGTCTCLTGRTGETCQVVAAADSSNVAGAVGGAAGALVVIIIVAVVIIRCRRRRNAKERDPTDSDTRGKAEPNSGETLNLSSIGPTESGRAGSSKPDKPQAPVKPMMRSETPGEISAENVYGNVPAGRSNVKSSHLPTLAPKPRLQESTYTNVSYPSPASHPPAAVTAKAPRTGKPPGDDGRDDLDDGLADEEDDTYNTADLYSSYKNMATRPELDVLQDYLLSALASGEVLSQQFAKFSKGMKFPHNDGMSDGNVCKNRFKAMCAYDFNRVHLRRSKGDPEPDYINASYIKGCRGDKQYIATQGPRDNTVADLWLMVWQEKVTQMVMLTNIQEDGKDKCEEYWPAPGTSMSCGDVIVEAVEEEQRADYVIRLFSLKDNGRSSELGRQVIQYHYTTWPDHGVPQAAALVDFWRYVKVRGDPTVPLLVHCSAGVGRTGTFIALDIASEREALGREVNVKDIVTELREQRSIMVQSESQYKFLHEVILEAHTSRVTRFGVVKFEEIFPGTITFDKPDERIDGEFKMLQEMGKHAPNPTHTMAEMEENRHKNRNQDALPDDKHLAYLTVHVRGRNQYINAVYMSSFLHHRGLLLTQLPIPNNTMMDFWRMVDECDVKIVVSLGSEEERETVNNFCQYWPQFPGEVMATGPFALTINSHNKMNNHLTSYGLTLKNKTDNREHAVQLFHYQAWAGEVPDDTATLLQLVDTIKARAEEDVTSPIVIQCIDGAAKSGLFCAIYDIISRVTHDDEIDVYLTSRHVQTVRPQAVATETQYRFLYHVAQEYVRSLNVYQNVGVS